MPEGDVFPFTRLYNKTQRNNPIMKEFYRMVVDDVCSTFADVGRILDVGTGPGFVPLMLAEKLLGVEILGVDISVDMVRLARRNAYEAKLSDRVKFQVENVAKMSLRDETFDLVLSTASLCQWRAPIDGINEIYRVLKDGGEAWIYDALKNPSKTADQRFRKTYGMLNYLILLLFRPQASMTLAEVRRILNNPEIRFEEKRTDNLGLCFRVRLKKTAGWS